MSFKPTIMKFGGTSVADADAFANVAAIVKANAKRPVVVVSAIAGFTNSLIASVDKAIAGDARSASKLLEPEFERHLAIAGEVLQGDRRAAYVSVAAGRARKNSPTAQDSSPRTRDQSPPLQDEIVAYGEHLSSHLMTAVLSSKAFRLCMSMRAVASRPTTITGMRRRNPKPLSP
jgi:aspartokinase